MTVLTITTAHNTAVSTAVLLGPHFLCTAIVRAHVHLPLVRLRIDKYTVPTSSYLCRTIVIHLCNERLTDSIHIVPYVDTLGTTQ